MADFDKKVGLIEVDVDYSASTQAVASFTEKIVRQKDSITANNQEIKALNKANVELEKKIKKGNVTFDKANKEIEENSKRVTKLKKENAFLGDEIKDLNKERANAVTATKLQAKSLDALKEKVKGQKKELGSLNLETKEGKKRFKELKKEVVDSSDKINELERGTGGFKDTLNQMPGVLGTTTSGIVSMTKAALAFIATPLGVFLAFVAGAISAVSAAFSDSEEGQNKFAKISGQIGVVLGNLRDILADVGDAIIAAFENPKQAWQSFVDSLKNGWQFVKGQVVDRFRADFDLLTGAFEASVLRMRIAWNDFTGDAEEAEQLRTELDKTVKKVKDAMETIKEKNEEIRKGFEVIINASKEFASKTKEEIELAAKVANDRAKADKLDRQLLVQRAKLESEIAELRLMSRQEEEFTANQRKKFLLEAQELEDSLLTKELESAQLRADAIKIENDFSRSSKENLDAQAEAEAKLFQIQAKRFNQQKSTQRELNRLNKELERDAKAAEKQQEADLKAQEVTDAKKVEMQEKLNAKLQELEDFRRNHSNKSRIQEIQDLRGQLAVKREVEMENFEMELERLEQEKELLNENDLVEKEEKLIREAEFQLQIEQLRAQHKDNINAIDEEQRRETLRIEQERNNHSKRLANEGHREIQLGVQVASNIVTNTYAKRFANLEKQFERGAITEEEYARRKEQLEKRQALAQYRAEKADFQLNKAVTISGIIRDIARANSKSVRNSPTTLGQPWVGINTALLLGELAKVSTQKAPPKPSFALGGDVFYNLVGGQRHSAGGTNYYGDDGNSFNVEQGEGIFVTKREATNPALHALSDANTAFGGRSMFESSARFLQEGGVVNQSAPTVTPEAIAEALTQMPNPVVDIESVLAGIVATEDAKKIGVI